MNRPEFIAYGVLSKLANMGGITQEQREEIERKKALAKNRSNAPVLNAIKPLGKMDKGASQQGSWDALLAFGYAPLQKQANPYYGFNIPESAGRGITTGLKNWARYSISNHKRNIDELGQMGRNLYLSHLDATNPAQAEQLRAAWAPKGQLRGTLSSGASAGVRRNSSGTFNQYADAMSGQSIDPNQAAYIASRKNVPARPQAAATDYFADYTGAGASQGRPVVPPTAASAPIPAAQVAAAPATTRRGGGARKTAPKNAPTPESQRASYTSPGGRTRTLDSYEDVYSGNYAPRLAQQPAQQRPVALRNNRPVDTRMAVGSQPPTRTLQATPEGLRALLEQRRGQEGLLTRPSAPAAANQALPVQQYRPSLGNYSLNPLNTNRYNLNLG